MKLTPRGTIKFGILVGFTAILMDAAIAHGLWWENDPYWTYWITKTFLIMSVFILGTAIIGIGVRQGIVITVIHVLMLEIYYQWFAPIGLPQEPFWLEHRDLWLPGYIVHYLVIFSGYLLALWVWLRNIRRKNIENQNASSVLWLFLSAITILVIDGIITSGILIQNFPGITFFIQHLLIIFTFLAAWGVFVGFDRRGIVGGALCLSLILTTYNMYVGPLGLPTQAPYYLGYTDLWLKSFPGAFIATFIGLWIFFQTKWSKGKPVLKNFNTFAIILGFILLPYIVSAKSPPDREGAKAETSGSGQMIVGPDPYDLESVENVHGSITVSATDVGNRWSQIQNIDEMKVNATITTPTSTYVITINKAMPRHPLGKYTTWMGVALHHSMHGDTGIGTDKIPEVKPEIALWGYATVEKDGQIISKMAPAHIMVMAKEPMRGITLEVDAEDKNLVGIPDGYIHIMWPTIDSLALPTTDKNSREAIGWLVLLGINALLWSFVRNEEKLIK